MAIDMTPVQLAIIDIRKRRSELRALWRLCGWGGAAAVALVAVAITSQTEAGGQKLQHVFSRAGEPARAANADVPARLVERVVEKTVENEATTRRLAAEVRTLTTDRDRLSIRLASLEQHLEDMTGSIKKQADPAAKASSPSPLEPTPVKTEPIKPPPAKPAPMPALSVLSMPALNTTPAGWSGDQAQAAAPATTAVPLPQARFASAPSESAPMPEPPSATTEFGVDLGGAASTDLLRLRWATVKANFGPLLAGLHAVAAHEHHPGAPSYRLVVGPLPDYAAAAKLCARITAARAICRPAKFDGQVLAQR